MPPYPNLITNDPTFSGQSSGSPPSNVVVFDFFGSHFPASNPAHGVAGQDGYPTTYDVRSGWTAHGQSVYSKLQSDGFFGYRDVYYAIGGNVTIPGTGIKGIVLPDYETDFQDYLGQIDIRIITSPALGTAFVGFSVYIFSDTGALMLGRDGAVGDTTTDGFDDAHPYRWANDAEDGITTDGTVHGLGDFTLGSYPLARMWEYLRQNGATYAVPVVNAFCSQQFVAGPFPKILEFEFDNPYLAINNGDWPDAAADGNLIAGCTFADGTLGEWENGNGFRDPGQFSYEPDIVPPPVTVLATNSDWVPEGHTGDTEQSAYVETNPSAEVQGYQAVFYKGLGTDGIPIADYKTNIAARLDVKVLGDTPDASPVVTLYFAAWDADGNPLRYSVDSYWSAGASTTTGEYTLVADARFTDIPADAVYLTPVLVFSDFFSGSSFKCWFNGIEVYAVEDPSAQLPAADVFPGCAADVAPVVEPPGIVIGEPPAVPPDPVFPLGDLYMAGDNPPAGLVGNYYIDAAVAQFENPADYEQHLLKPTASPYARRVDKEVNFPSENPPEWQPPGPVNGEHFSVRWIGAIKLAVAQNDYALRINSDDRVRVWVAKTFRGQEYIDDWTHAGHTMPHYATGLWLRDGSPASASPTGDNAGILAGRGDGWYPIVIEYSQSVGAAGIILEWSRDDAVGSWSVVHEDSLSPLGVFDQNVRLDAHHDVIDGLIKSFGFQASCWPKGLESGEFPGRLSPYARLGRDTEYIVDGTEVADMQASLSAEEVADVLVGEGRGTAAQGSDETLTLEKINYPAVAAALMMQSESESAQDISIPQLLQQRLESLLALRGGPFEEISVRPPGVPQLLAMLNVTEPGLIALSDQLADLQWLPGDGMRLRIPELGVTDDTPRQLLGVKFKFSPEGRGSPEVTYRQRPRSLKQIMRDMIRVQRKGQRYYQGTVVTLMGNLASNDSAVAATDTSRAFVPLNSGDVIGGELNVAQKSNTSSMTLTMNGFDTGLTIKQPGSFDVSNFIRPFSVHTNREVNAKLSGGSGSWSAQLVLLIRRY